MAKAIFNRSGEHSLSMISPETYYNQNKVNGYAVIINNFEFSSTCRLSDLTGGKDDTQRLDDTFSALNFKVRIYENHSKDKIMSVLKKYGDKDHSKYNMFVCLLSSHGSNSSIYGSDGEPLMLIDLMSNILNCESLKEKPKLFFIDACRTLSQNTKIVVSEKNADYIMCYSTLEGNYALMLDNSEKFQGSTFCKILCDKFRRYGDEMALHNILQELKSAMNEGDKRQKVEIKDSLTKILWFIPENLTKNYKWAVAIDFGTSMSGFAYSTKEEFDHSPLSICHKQCWNNESNNHDTAKTASCLLLDHNNEFVSFGFDAQAKFVQLQMEDKHNQYHYFNNFKMSIYDQKDSLSKLQLMDLQEHLLPAKYVFSSAIKAIKQEVLKTLALQYENLCAKKIRWVLTVPALWPEDAKLFMRECAKEAELPWEQLLIALEPEAASIYCQFSKTLKDTDTETKYMVVDIGGGTTDITIHGKQKDGQLRELKKPSGLIIGSSYINDKIIEMFEKIFGKRVMKKLRKENPSAYLDLCWEIEAVKKTVIPCTSDNIRIAISYPVFNRLCKTERGQSIKDVIAGYSKDASKVQLKDDKLVIQKDLLLHHFKHVVDLIVQEAKKATESINISYIILVGGFANCQFVKDEMKLCFHDKGIFSPEDANLAVLRGAVLYGHKPTMINPRITKFTYGIQVNSPFDEKKHDPSRRIQDEWGDWRCKHAFSMIIRQNKNVHLGKIIDKRYSTSSRYQKEIDFNVFTSKTDNPLYTDDGICRKIGNLRVRILEPSEQKNYVDVQFIFGDTELKIKANISGKHEERCFFLD